MHRLLLHAAPTAGQCGKGRQDHDSSGHMIFRLAMPDLPGIWCHVRGGGGLRREGKEVITHPGLFLSGPLANGDRDQLGFVAVCRVIHWWSDCGPFYNSRMLSRPHTKPFMG